MKRLPARIAPPEIKRTLLTGSGTTGGFEGHLAARLTVLTAEPGLPITPPDGLR